VTLVLENPAQSAIRRLLMIEPEPGSLLPDQALLTLGQLVGCDQVGVNESDNTGLLLRYRVFPSIDLGDPQVCDGPLHTGIWHDAEQSHEDREAPGWGLRDFLRLGFDTSSGTVVQLNFDRYTRYYTARDLAVVTMVEPVIRRLVRGGLGRAPTASLSTSERRVLTLVAQGATNREAAEELYVTVDTVRKHLQNAYRKLGVTNRTAAALHLRAQS
jgi:DNA-binding CsgD family transcriptional regulator